MGKDDLKTGIEVLPGYAEKHYKVLWTAWHHQRIKASLRDAASIAQLPRDPEFLTLEQFLEEARQAYTDVRMDKSSEVRAEMLVWAEEQSNKQEAEFAVATSDNKEEPKS